MTRHDVAVVLAVHNGARYVAESIESVLEQTLPPAEVVVVDDGSTDETAAVIASFDGAVRVLSQANGGYAFATNRGVAATTAPLLAFQDADDVAVPTKLETLVRAIEHVPGLDAVFGALEQFVSPDIDVALRDSFLFDPEPATVELLTTGVIRRNTWDALGGLDVSIRTASNVDLFSRMLAGTTRVGHIDTLVYRRRLHETNVGVREPAQKRADLLSIVRSHIDRRRTHVVDARE